MDLRAAVTSLLRSVTDDGLGQIALGEDELVQRWGWGGPWYVKVLRAKPLEGLQFAFGPDPFIQGDGRLPWIALVGAQAPDDAGGLMLVCEGRLPGLGDTRMVVVDTVDGRHLEVIHPRDGAPRLVGDVNLRALGSTLRRMLGLPAYPARASIIEIATRALLHRAATVQQGSRSWLIEHDPLVAVARDFGAEPQETGNSDWLAEATLQRLSSGEPRARLACVLAEIIADVGLDGALWMGPDLAIDAIDALLPENEPALELANLLTESRDVLAARLRFQARGSSDEDAVTPSGLSDRGGSGDSGWPYNIETIRLETGPVGDALRSPDRRGARLAANILAEIDQGEGWVSGGDDHWIWYPTRLGVELRSATDAQGHEFLTVDTRVVVLPRGAPEPQELLNELNVHAAGWWWWFDDRTDTVFCSMRCRADPAAWSWPHILLGILPLYATAADAMADRVAEVTGGDVAVALHPERGLRPDVDGFVVAARMGPRDPSASLDVWISTLDYARLDTALSILSGEGTSVGCPLFAEVTEQTGQPRIVLRRHWHPELGWGWQMVCLSGVLGRGGAVSDEIHRVCSLMNRRQHDEPAGDNRFGSWVHIPGLGLTHHTFIPAGEIEKLACSALATFGNVAALMIDVERSKRDLDDLIATARPSLDGPLTMYNISPETLTNNLPVVNMTTGPKGWPYFDQRVQKRVQSGWTAEGDASGAEDGGDLWLVPRHAPICGFGNFNPMGPTVGSLEAAVRVAPDGTESWVLYYVQRHPVSPSVRYLGHAEDLDSFGPLIIRALNGRDPEVAVFGSGPEWLDIWMHEDAVLEGVRQFARASPEADWSARAALLRRSSNPWDRLSDSNAPDDRDAEDEGDQIEAWLAAITNLDVVASHQLFLRSAWEPARA
jgi:hypothetical protein